MKRGLLDINLLIALLDLDHSHHHAARRWMEHEAKHGWASCPITQNGCVRIMSQLSYPSPLPPQSVIVRLTAGTQTAHHEFWADDLTLLDTALVRPDHIHGPKQVTDVYLLAFAVKHDGLFVTFETTVPTSAVPAARKHHLVVV